MNKEDKTATTTTAAATSAAAEATGVEHEEKETEVVASSPKRRHEDPISSGSRASKARAEPQRTKRPETQPTEQEHKHVRFDPDAPIAEPSPKTSKVTEQSTASASTTVETGHEPKRKGVVRRVIEDIELYDEDEEEIGGATEYGGDEEEWISLNDSGAVIPAEDKQKRGFLSEGQGPPTVTPEELALLDKEALFTELDRLGKLQALESISEDQKIGEATELDTRVVFDWRFRNDCWTRRARLVAREFRTTNSTADTFAPTSPFAYIKMLFSLSILQNLMVSVYDVSDAFLQVPRSDFVVAQVPEWV